MGGDGVSSGTQVGRERAVRFAVRVVGRGSARTREYVLKRRFAMYDTKGVAEAEKVAMFQRQHNPKLLVVLAWWGPGLASELLLSCDGAYPSPYAIQCSASLTVDICLQLLLECYKADWRTCLLACECFFEPWHPAASETAVLQNAPSPCSRFTAKESHVLFINLCYHLHRSYGL